RAPKGQERERQPCERQMSWWDGCSGGGPALPERLPLALLATVQGASVAQRVRALFPPAHPRPLQPLTYHRLARTLHRPTADLPALGLVLRVLHPMHVVAEVLRHPRQLLPQSLRLPWAEVPLLAHG